jgi:16S rRNA (cytosine967-C5)-methyltransferase
MTAPARVAAFRALVALSSNRIDLGDALSRTRDSLADTRDRALTTDLVTGTLRWQGAIDYQLQRLSSKPLPRLDGTVLTALRLGAYQILYLERVPVSAIVNDTVQLVRAAGFSSASGFVNAVLRRLSRERADLSWPERPGSAGSASNRLALVEYLSVVHSHPAWLVERLLDRYGVDDTEDWLAFNNRPPAMTVASNRVRLTRDELAVRLAAEGVETTPTRVASHALTIVHGRVLASPSYEQGLCLVQDESSQLIAELVRGAPGQRVLDACASPGGKTVALAAFGPRLLVASDVRPRRVRLLTDTLRRCQISAARVVHVSDRDALPFADASFDRVLVDAPCSGLGTVRRDPDIRWKRQQEHLARFAQQQQELLIRIRPLVARGGRLIYSTCSSEPEENEAVVATFLESSPEFRLVPMPAIDALPAALARMSTAEGYLRTTPKEGLEAFFGAVLERRL